MYSTLDIKHVTGQMASWIVCIYCLLLQSQARDLRTAIREGDNETVRKMIEEECIDVDANIEAVDTYNYTKYINSYTVELPLF